MLNQGQDNPPILPHGARRLTVADLTIAFGRDKVVVPIPGQHRHVTLHLGHKSKWMDIHETIRTPDGREQHDKLFRISHDNLNAMLLEFDGPMHAIFRRVLRPLRPGWMARRSIGGVYGLNYR
jgi:hypothetical protein